MAMSSHHPGTRIKAHVPPAERQREKRARDRAKVWSPDEDLRGLSDTGLLEQLAIAFRKERN